MNGQRGRTTIDGVAQGVCRVVLTLLLTALGIFSAQLLAQHAGFEGPNYVAVVISALCLGVGIHVQGLDGVGMGRLESFLLSPFVLIASFAVLATLAALLVLLLPTVGHEGAPVVLLLALAALKAAFDRVSRERAPVVAVATGVGLLFAAGFLSIAVTEWLAAPRAHHPGTAQTAFSVCMVVCTLAAVGCGAVIGAAAYTMPHGRTVMLTIVRAIGALVAPTLFVLVVARSANWHAPNAWGMMATVALILGVGIVAAGRALEQRTAHVDHVGKQDAKLGAAAYREPPSAPPPAPLDKLAMLPYELFAVGVMSFGLAPMLSAAMR
ncbi:MAG: hypothetical protein HOV80_00865 [Polyangiaceae bacterium]|nr:hypothetical protein [Polyangiaceae bacterium]